ncbi:hypothetical protein [Clostridium estertheticum]|nr:hypothetical protein [Clostridium estertheticum]
MQRAYFNLGNGYHIWCPKLAVIVDGSATAVSKGWVNGLSNDWSRIYQSNTEHDVIIKEKHLEILRITSLLRARMLLEEMYIVLLEFLNIQKMSLHLK